MRLSIIVPVTEHVTAQDVTRCLDSLLMQQCKEYEIVVAADGGTEELWPLLQAYESKSDGAIKVHTLQEKRGAGGAKNKALRAVKGEWVSFTEPADYVEPAYYGRLLEQAETTEADVLGEYGDEEAGKGECLATAGASMNGLYRYRIFYENGIWFPEELVCENYGVTALLLLYAENVVYADVSAGYVHCTDNATTAAEVLRECDDRMTVMDYFMSECYKRCFLEEYPEELEYYYTRISYLKNLFTYMDRIPHAQRKVSYLKELRECILDVFPEFDTNPFYVSSLPEEVQELVEMHCKSPAVFNRKYAGGGMKP